MPEEPPQKAIDGLIEAHRKAVDNYKALLERMSQKELKFKDEEEHQACMQFVKDEIQHHERRIHIIITDFGLPVNTEGK